MQKYITQFASHNTEDSMSLEILDESGNDVAMVTRVDGSNKLKV